MDYTKLPIERQIELLKFCKKENFDPSKISQLMEILGIGPKPKKDIPDRPVKPATTQKHNYRELRKATGKSADTVATELNMSMMTLRGVENGKGKPRPATYAKLNQYYGVE